MDNFSEIEDLINKKVKEAINSINLAKDKYNNSEAKNILNNILSGVKNGVELASQKIENAKLEEIKKRNKIIKKEKISLCIAKKPTGKIFSYNFLFFKGEFNSSNNCVWNIFNNKHINHNKWYK